MAVGHNQQGQLVLLHVDGQIGIRGLNLWEMADFLKQRGVVNAINLDGGGSATLVLNGTLASYPSDHCLHDAMWRCPRSISTVLCVHEPFCQSPDCSGHGRCVLGQCLCEGAFWSGPACDVLDCGPSNCSLHGRCTEMGCLCDAGWTGVNCSQAWQCPLSTKRRNELLFPEGTWFGITFALLVLLLVSAAVNVKLIVCNSTKPHTRGHYSSLALEETNGETSRQGLPAAWEMDDPTEAAWDSNQLERVELL